MDLNILCLEVPRLSVMSLLRMERLVVIPWYSMKTYKTNLGRPCGGLTIPYIAGLFNYVAACSVMYAHAWTGTYTHTEISMYTYAGISIYACAKISIYACAKTSIYACDEITMTERGRTAPNNLSVLAAVTPAHRIPIR